MKIAMKRLIRDEKGAALMLALILLLIGGLISAALLGHMGAGILAGEVYEKRTAELYAADAGVEDAIWIISRQSIEPWLWQESDDYLGWWVYEYPEPLIVNDRSVDITLYRQDLDPTCGEDFRYRIISTAASADGGNTAAIVSSTMVEAYVTTTGVSANYSGILDQVITSQGDLNENELEKVTISYAEGHEPLEYYGGPWPTAGDLADWYWEDVKSETPYPYSTIDLEGIDMDEGPFYRDGGLEILNSSNDPVILTLTGTVYITGDTLIGKNGKDNMILDLNGHTIFVASNSSGPQKALWIGGKVTIEGPGVIIAVGDIYFEPKMEAGMTEPIFILSVDGTTTLKPSGSFYGAVAGSVDVEVYSGKDPAITYPEEEGWYEDFNFPIGDIQDQQLVYSIYSWEITQQ